MPPTSSSSPIILPSSRPSTNAFLSALEVLSAHLGDRSLASIRDERREVVAGLVEKFYDVLDRERVSEAGGEAETEDVSTPRIVQGSSTTPQVGIGAATPNSSLPVESDFEETSSSIDRLRKLSQRQFLPSRPTIKLRATPSQPRSPPSPTLTPCATPPRSEHCRYCSRAVARLEDRTPSDESTSAVVLFQPRKMTSSSRKRAATEDLDRPARKVRFEVPTEPESTTPLPRHRATPLPSTPILSTPLPASSLSTPILPPRTPSFPLPTPKVPAAKAPRPAFNFSSSSLAFSLSRHALPVVLPPPPLKPATKCSCPGLKRSRPTAAEGWGEGGGSKKSSSRAKKPYDRNGPKKE